MINKTVFLFVIFIFITNSAFALGTNDSSKSEKSFGVVGAPYLSHSPETEWSYGLAGLFYFQLENSNINKTRLSSVYLNTQYTTKKQFTLKAEYDFYFLQDIYRIYGDVAYSKFPSQFFGIGNNTSISDEENYAPRNVRFDVNIIRKIFLFDNGKVSAGIRFDYRNDKIIKKEDYKKLLTEYIPGNNGGTISGIGFSVNYDSRDNSFSTTEGLYCDYKATFYNKFLGSDFTYRRYTFDLRKFSSLEIFDTTHIVALQMFTDLLSGTAPFYLLPTYGGDMNLRGIYLGRFRDKNSLFLQSEYRFPVFWRFGLALFGGIGQVFNKINLFRLNEFNAAGGVGIRFSVIPKEQISVRIDFGFSRYKSEFYLSFNEAF